MRPEPAVNLTVRLPRALIEHIDFQAHEQRLIRAEGLRNAIRAFFDRELQRAHLDGLEKRLTARLEQLEVNSSSIHGGATTW